MNFATRQQIYINAYASLFTGTRKWKADEGDLISREDFAFGYALYAFDLTADQCDGDHFNLVKQGNVRLDMEFAQALANTINVSLQPLQNLKTFWRLAGRGTFSLITRTEEERIENRIDITERSKMQSRVSVRSTT